MTVQEFWDMSPRETFMVIEAWQWRDERAQKQQLVQAWHTAALTRTKKLPSLSSLLPKKPAKPLARPELEERKRRFAELSAAFDEKMLKASKDKET